MKQTAFWREKKRRVFTYLLHEQLTGLQLVKKFTVFHGIRKFITALTTVRHLSLSWDSPIQSIYPHPTSCRSILILSTHLRQGLPSGLFPSCYPTKILYTPLSSPIRSTCPAHLITALTTVRHLSLSWDSPINSTYPHPTSRISILILSTHLRLGLPIGLFPSGFPTKTLYTKILIKLRRVPFRLCTQLPAYRTSRPTGNTIYKQAFVQPCRHMLKM